MKNQTQHGGARNGSGRKSKIVATAPELEKMTMQTTQPTFETLQDELAALPVLLIQAADTGDASKILALKTRGAALPLEIEAAKIPALQAELAALESKVAPFSAANESLHQANIIAAALAKDATQAATDAQWAWSDAIEASRENTRAIGFKKHELSDAKAALVASATGRRIGGFSQ
jgi:hypothetical protein